jgi:hypothetical protein
VPLVGNLFTSLEMMGVTLTLMKLDDELEACLKAPASSVGLTVAGGGRWARLQRCGGRAGCGSLCARGGQGGIGIGRRAASRAPQCRWRAAARWCAT